MLDQYFAYRESSHWRKGAARHIIDMVGLYCSPIQSTKPMSTAEIVGFNWFKSILLEN